MLKLKANEKSVRKNLHHNFCPVIWGLKLEQLTTELPIWTALLERAGVDASSFRWVIPI